MGLKHGDGGSIGISSDLPGKHDDTFPLRFIFSYSHNEFRVKVFGYKIVGIPSIYSKIIFARGA